MEQSGISTSDGLALPVCGENNTLPAHIVGCGKQIESWSVVYRCTHCDVPFHKECANKHFEGGVLTQEHLDAMTEEEINRAYAALRAVDKAHEQAADSKLVFEG